MIYTHYIRKEKTSDHEPINDTPPISQGEITEPLALDDYTQGFDQGYLAGKNQAMEDMAPRQAQMQQTFEHLRNQAHQLTDTLALWTSQATYAIAAEGLQQFIMQWFTQHPEDWLTYLQEFLATAPPEPLTVTVPQERLEIAQTLEHALDIHWQSAPESHPDAIWAEWESGGQLATLSTLLDQIMEGLPSV